jgi:hypothetical protein
MYNTDIGIIRQDLKINMAMALVEKVDNIKEQLGNVSRDGNSKIKTSTNQKHCNRHEDCLWFFHQ